MSDPYERIAVLETKVDRLADDLSKFAESSTSARHTQSDIFKKRTDELEAKLDTILNAFAQAVGAKRMLIVLAGLASTLNAFAQAVGAKRMLIVLAGLASTLTGYIAAKWDVVSHFFNSPR